MKRAIIYTRVSTDDQAKFGYSLRSQEEALRHYCKHKNIEVIQHYEEDFSGKDFDRPSFIQLIKYCQKEHKNIDLLLFTKWDRFSRNHGETYGIFTLFQKLNIEINAIEQPTNDDPASKMIRGMHLMFGEMEREIISDRTKLGMRRSKKEGNWTGHPPRGYYRIRTKNNKPTLVLNKDANTVRKIFLEIASGVYSAEHIRKKYYSKLKISKTAFYNMLKSYAYIGKIYIEKYREMPSEIVDGLHEPIIDIKTFNAVQNIFNKTTKVKINKTNPSFILRGHLLCNSCGKKLTGSFSTSRTKKRYPYYHCQNECKERFSTTLADDEFNNFLKDFQLKPEMSSLLSEMIKRGMDDSKKSIYRELKSIEKSVNVNHSRIDNIYDKYADNEISKLEYDDLKNNYLSKIRELKAEKSNLKSINTDKTEQLSNTIKLLSNLANFYKKIDFELKQKLIGSIFNENLIFDGKKYRTNKSNKLVELIFLKVNELKKLKIKKAGKNTRLSCYAPPLGLEPRTL